MILLNTNAQNIFWLGRYLSRIQYTCSQFPFTDNQTALEYAQAFCLPAYDAHSLNVFIQDPEQAISFEQQFQCTKNNIHDLRGILTAKSFAELNLLIGQAEKNRAYICDIAGDCNEVLESEENTSIFLFFSLGQRVEQLDRCLRLKQDVVGVLSEIQKLIPLVYSLGFTHLKDAWERLKKNVNIESYFTFSHEIHSLFVMERL